MTEKYQERRGRGDRSGASGNFIKRLYEGFRFSAMHADKFPTNECRNCFNVTIN